MWTKAGVVMPGNTRAHAQQPDWHSEHSRDGNGENSTAIPRRGIPVCFPQLAPIPISDILRVCLLARYRTSPSLVFVCTYAPRRTPYTRALSRVEARTVYKYNETCEPHNITSLLSLARDID